MAGNESRGKKAANTNKEKYGKDFYSKIGAKGGRLGKTGGFAAGLEGRERASWAGRIGGLKSRRNKKEE